MQKIASSVFDIIPFSNGILYTKIATLENGSTRIRFFGYDIKRMQQTPVTKSVYLLNKYGSGFKKIAEQLGDYVSCDADIMPSKNVVVVYPSGETGIFSPEGEALWSNDLQYHEKEIRGVACDGNEIWSVVPDLNCLVCYSLSHKKFSMRIGAEKASTFDKPVSVYKYNDELFISNENSNKVRTVNLKDFSVNDFRIFDEPVHKYIRSCGKEIVMLDSGVYIL